jgi:hypothetical protein
VRNVLCVEVKVTSHGKKKNRKTIKEKITIIIENRNGTEAVRIENNPVYIEGSGVRELIPVSEEKVIDPFNRHLSLEVDGY